ncbi:MAG: pyridoxamine 5'-phosphate oxidase family protein [Desulfatiglandales bacterium]
MEELKRYFDNTKGTGILSTAGSDGRVDAAVYSRPHIMEDGTLAFIMRDRLTHKNINENPHAAFLFIEDGPGYRGKRLFITKVGEETESELLYKLRRRTFPAEKDRQEVKFLVFFKLDMELPLVGSAAAEK